MWKNKNSLPRRQAVCVDLDVCQRIVVFTVPSSKQREPDLLGEKQASDDGYAAMQTRSTYWAVFYSKSEMCQ